MKFYMRQNFFAIRENFDIVNQYETPVFRIESKFFSLGRQSKIIDAQTGQVVAELKGTALHIFPKLDIYINGSYKGRVAAKFSFPRPKYTLEKIGWNINGDIWSHNYEITANDGKLVAIIRKSFFAFSDTFELDVQPDFDQGDNLIKIIAVVVAIDVVMDNAENSNSG